MEKRAEWYTDKAAAALLADAGIQEMSREVDASEVDTNGEQEKGSKVGGGRWDRRRRKRGCKWE